MKNLFFALFASVILSVLFLAFTLKKSYNNTFKKIILKYIIRPITIIFLIAIAVCAFNLSIFHLLLYILACLGFVFIYMGFYFIFKFYDDEGLYIVILGIVALVLGSIGICTLNFYNNNITLPEKEIILFNYCNENLKNDEKVIVIEINEDNTDIKSFAIYKYKIDSDTNLPFYFDDIDEYNINKSNENKIVISTTEKIETDLLSFFEVSQEKISYNYTYTLFINSNDILYN